MRRIFGCFIFIMIIITSQIFAGTVYYVDATNGNDVNPGTEFLPWRTIQKAANSMVAGDTVIVKAGTYKERVSETTSGSSGNLIIYIANSGDTVTVDGGFTISGNYIRLDGFRVTGSTTCTYSSTDYGIYVAGDYVEIENCYTYKNKHAGIKLYSASSHCTIKNCESYQDGGMGAVVDGTYHIIEGCEVHDVRCAPCSSDADGFNLYGSHLIFKDNYIHDITYTNNPGYSPHIDAFQLLEDAYCDDITFEGNYIDLIEWGSLNAYGKGWEMDNASNITIKNNIIRAHVGIKAHADYPSSDVTIVNNTFVSDLNVECEVGVDCWSRAIIIGGDNFTVKNNIFVDWAYKHIDTHGSPTSVDIDYNCFWNSDGSSVGYASGYGPQPHDLWETDPKFVNLSGGDYHLLSNSLCFDAGVTLSEVTSDYDGNSRPQGAYYDIGAYEYVGENPPLSVNINASPNSGEVPLTINFTGSAAGGTEPYTYAWDFGDGTSSTEQNPSHIYNDPGDYTVTLTVTDSESNQDSNSVIINANAAVIPLEASCAASPNSGEVPLTINFTGNASGGAPPYTYTWGFGDGTSSTEQNPSHTYNDPGDYTVTLTVTDSLSNQDSDSLTINASAPTISLEASCAASPVSGEAPLTVNFTGNATGGVLPYSYSWDFGDGTSSSEQNPTHTYNDADDYTTTLTVTDSDSNQDSDSLIINVSAIIIPPEASFIASPTSGEVPLTVDFTGSATGGIEPYTYSWGFGDGTSSNEQNPSHIYNDPGDYTVTLTVTDSDSNQDSDSLTINASAPAIPLEVSCNASPISGEAPLTVNFTGSATGGVLPYSYSWDFGDGTSSSEQNPSHTYSETGDYVITLNVTDSENTQDSDSLTINVFVTEAYISCTPKNLYFGASASGYETTDQNLRIINAGRGKLTWNIEDNTDWLSCSPSSGLGRRKIAVSADASGLALGLYTATITVSSPEAYNSPQYVSVNLRVYEAGHDSSPFGYFDTPVDGSVVSGCVSVTGWALDDIEVTRLEIKRNSDPEDLPEAIGPDGLVYIGDAVFVEGARPDVENSYPDYPLSSRAGWGYTLLTNDLPNRGNGSFTIYGFAYDASGHKVEIGRKTIVCDNANSTKPFGTIDTPEQGEVIGGSDYINFGWALTPLPKTIPKDGNTIWVWVDGVQIGHPVYNQYREDIATSYPEYNNAQGAVGYYYLDTTQYENGVHTIAWSVMDDEGEENGIGSRYFSVDNTEATYASPGYLGLMSIHREDAEGRLRIGIKEVRREYGPQVNSDREMDTKNILNIQIEEMEPLRLVLEESSKGNIKYIGWGESESKALPIGSTLDREKGIFSWIPTPGFIGRYVLYFAVTDGSYMSKPVQVAVNIIPKSYD